jgi:hypothetical protein
MENVMSEIPSRIAAALVALICATPIAALAQTTTANGNAGETSRTWIVLGGTSTTLRGDCQEDCVAHGTGDYLHSGSFIGMAGTRVNRKANAGGEVSWVPATARDGSAVRSTFLLAAGQFRPWDSHGFFVKGAMGMVFVRNFVYDGTGTLPPITSKALGLSYAAGWVFRRERRVGFEVFGAQHLAALGDFQTGGTTATDVIANYWSIGAAIVLR